MHDTFANSFIITSLKQKIKISFIINYQSFTFDRSY